MKSVLKYFIIAFFISLNTAFALSEYGLRCDNNPECVQCRDEADEVRGLHCQKCMHACWNKFGPAEYSNLSSRSTDDAEQCRLKWAKWCNAQCWDPDDRTDPEYVSTKPLCNPDFVFPKYNKSRIKPW